MNQFNQFRKLLRRPKEWHVNQFEITHRKTGLSLWIANGWMMIEDPCRGCMSRNERWKLWPMIISVLNTKPRCHTDNWKRRISKMKLEHGFNESIYRGNLFRSSLKRLLAEEEVEA